MNIENFRLNKILIEEGRATDFYLFILESDKDFENDFKQKDLFYLVNIDSVNLDFVNTEVSNLFLEPSDQGFSTSLEQCIFLSA